MVTEPQITAIKAYARRVRDERRAHPGVTEPGLAPAFHQFLIEVLPSLPAAPHDLVPLAEFINAGVGRPDIAMKRPGELARAFVELKSLDKPTDGSRWKLPHDKRQFGRFCEFPAWATCNFHEVRLYTRDKDEGYAALVPQAALDPSQTDVVADKLIEAHDPTPALRLLERLAQSDPPSAKDAEHLAELLAHSAKLVRGIIRDRLAELKAEKIDDAPLQQVRKEFRDILYSHPEAGGYSSKDFDDLFSSAFAQTLAFGLLLVREATGDPVNEHAADHMPGEHPLMKSALSVLSMAPIRQEVGAGFDVMLQTVNGFNPAILAIRKDGSDPILYFYEDFLKVFSPKDREKYGVYYTPIEVVRFMVGALDRALKDHGLAEDGIADPQVHILDPATGTGTFLLGVADRLRRDIGGENGPGPGHVPAALKGLAGRMYGFELLIGPYAVAHYRLHHALSRKPDGTTDTDVKLPRLGIYLADTLADPNRVKDLAQTSFVYQGMMDEAKAAHEVKAKQEILAIIGNPPYRRLKEGENETLVGRWMDGLWEDLKKPVSDAGYGGQLNTFPELSVAFWRWAMWKLFESENAPKKGVVAFITNRTFLKGKPYSGLRKMMRERFDQIEVIDLRGDVRLGPRAGVDKDQGVFSIMVGTAITVAIADGSKPAGALARVSYNDAWLHERWSKKDKEHWLASGAGTGALGGGVSVERGAIDDMRPIPFTHLGMIGMQECFLFRGAGVQTKRDSFVYDVDRSHLQDRIEKFISGSSSTEFRGTEKKVKRARINPIDIEKIQKASIAPLDVQWLYNHSAFIDRPRPKLQGAWGKSNLAFYTLASGVSSGPAIWCHGYLPDNHAFRGSYGGYAFPLYDRRGGPTATNIRPELIEALSDAYGSAVKPETVFDVILALLSATSYTTRFAEDLEDVFPHIPFPADHKLFDKAAEIGAEIRAVQSFARKPKEKFAKGIARIDTPPKGLLAPIEPGDYKDGGVALCADGSGRVSNIPLQVWDFEVSGYRVLPRWLAAREGREIDEKLGKDMRDVAGRIAELVDLFCRADTILIRTLDDPLSRDSLDLAARAANEDEEPTDDDE